MVEPGSTIDVAIQLRSTSQFASGAVRAGVIVTYNSTYLTATNIEQGGFMSLRQETTVETNTSEINNDDGYLIYELERNPANGGASGFATFTTVTFEIDEDTPTTAFKVSFADHRVLLTDGMFQRVVTDDMAIIVDASGGEPTETSDGTPSDQQASPTTAEPGQQQSTDNGSSGFLFGFAAFGGIIGLLAGLFQFVRRF